LDWGKHCTKRLKFTNILKSIRKKASLFMAGKLLEYFLHPDTKCSLLRTKVALLRNCYNRYTQAGKVETVMLSHQNLSLMFGPVVYHLRFEMGAFEVPTLLCALL
jgi:hypothetical protein